MNERDQQQLQARAGRRMRVYAGGRKRRKPEDDVPLEALQRRGEGAGMPTAMLERGDPGTVRRVRHDGAMASALGRMIWGFDGLGRRRRRLVSYGAQAGREPLISESMEMGALAYQQLWFRWHRLSGLPLRSAQAMDLSAIKVDCSAWEQQGRGQDGLGDEAQLMALKERLRQVEVQLDRCTASQLVRKVIEMVLIDDVFVPLLLERPVALEAFRDGLRVLEAVFVKKT